MVLDLNYETLFEIAISHHYHLDDGATIFDTLSADARLAMLERYDIGSFMSVVPTRATRAKFAGLHVVCKQTETGIITGIPYTLNGTKEQPQIVPADNTVFSFSVAINDGLFANYSSLPLKAPDGMVYFFTNDPSLSPRVAPFLTATPNVYKAATAYYPGDMLVDNQAAPTKLFIAQQKNNLDPAAAATPAGNWITDALVGGKPLSYAGSADLIRQCGRVFTYQVTVAGKTPALTIKDRQGNVINVITSLETGPLNIVKADMGSLPEGLYTAHLADTGYTDDFPFYYSTDASAWAFIDICVKTSNAVYNLLQADTTLKAPVFSLRFKNRATYWRYIGKTFGAASVSDSALPLTKQGFITVKVKDKNNNPTTVDLPNATASLIKPETNQIFFRHIFLGSKNSNMATTYKTPGVYVEEIPLLPPSVAEVETAIPAFIGYTQNISYNGASLQYNPVRIKSLKEYEQIFGFAENTLFTTTGTPTGIKIKKAAGVFSFDAAIDDPYATLKFRMYYCLQLYFANGGGPCYIVSAGQTGAAVNVDKALLTNALAAVQKEDEPTILLFTDAVTLTVAADYYGLYTAALAQAAFLQDRVVLIDPYVAVADKGKKAFGDIATAFRTAIGVNNLSYGAAYYPWLQTSINYFSNESKQLIVSGTGVTTTDFPATAVLRDDTNTANSIYHINSDLYNYITQQTNLFSVILPPAAAIAGVYASVDNTRGVWKAPANVSLNLVVAPMVKIDDADQEDMNVTSTGKSVNAIRAFSGKGVLVWGARTLAGNDNEWRYISVRRFFNMVEESVKNSTQPFVFEPNDGNTWAKVRGMIANFLILQWRAGALQGAKPEDAFFVHVGLGETMTSLDILEGRLIVEVGMAVVRPAEFIILRFSHKMVQS